MGRAGLPIVLAGIAVAQEPWTQAGCNTENHTAELDLRCCQGWRPECHSECDKSCIVLRKECSDDLQEWNIECAPHPMTEALLAALGAGGALTAAAGSGGHALIVAGITGSGAAVSPQVIRITFESSSSEAVCATLADNAWMDNFKKALGNILDVPWTSIDSPTVSECAGLPRRGAQPLTGSATQPFLFTSTSQAPTEAQQGRVFTTFNGKQTQFYLPLDAGGRRAKATSLMTCKGVEIYGSAFGSGIPGDTQQWFGAFEVSQHGRRLLRVEVADPRAVVNERVSAGAGALSAATQARRRAADLLADAAAASAAHDLDLTVAQIVESRVAAALQALHFSKGARDAWRAPPRPRPLTTLNVTVLGREVTQTEAHTISRDGKGRPCRGPSCTDVAFVAVTQDPSLQIGTGYAETVALGVEDVGVEFTTAVAERLNGTEAVRKTHIDLRFTQLHAAECWGALPEIWGVRPMTARTAMMLLPPKL